MSDNHKKDELFDLNSYRSNSSDSKNKNKKKKRNVKRSKKENVLRIVLASFLLCVTLACFVLGGFLVYVFNFIDGDFGVNLDELKLNCTTTVYVQGDAEGEWVEYQRLYGNVNRIWVAYEDIPDTLKNAFVAVEDKRFLKHGGVDWKRTFSAFANYFLNFYSSKQGGSTITQQLVKNLTGDNDRSPERKVREIMRARFLETNYSKETILECYLNVVSMSNNISGVEVAANFYFNKSLDELTLAECASLAGITKNPEKYRPDKNPNDNKERRNTVLKLMYEQKMITSEEYQNALEEELNVVADSANIKQVKINSYFVDALIDEVIADLKELYKVSDEDASVMFYNGGYQIYSTMDPDIQNTIDEVYSNSDKYGLKSGGEMMQGAITVMDYSGHIKGMAGGIGAKTENRGFNRATMAIRQPGSTMKPIAAYAPAIEKNIITYSSVVNDTRYKYGSWSPNNWYGGYWGYITAHYALERSVNTIPVYLVNEMKPETSYKFLTDNLGISTLKSTDINLSALGMGGTDNGITTTQSAAAFAVFGNLGKYYSPTTYHYITDMHGNEVLRYSDVGIQAIGEDTASVMNHMLQNVVYGANGTGASAKGYVSNMKIYAKTGTSNSTNDLWFVGGSPYYITSCWAGYDNNRTIKNSSIAKSMWGAVMKPIHQGLKAKEFEESRYVSQRYYCAETGLLATNACTSKGVGYYKNSYLPTCSLHSGKILSPIKGTSETQSGASGVVKGKVNGTIKVSSDTSEESTPSEEETTENQTEEQSDE
ncbi:MAG: transglycosylase domain-containing protein [Acutalibacteraceae bacterium]|nr:transglycosylase domain-containing protein [Acutalibacteraceae bacterium]